MQNLTAFLRYHALRRPDAPALLWDGDTIGYADLLDRAMRLAGWLHRQGIGDGAVVALVMKNSPAFLELTFRSEEHTSELQSLMRISDAVVCLKKKTKHQPTRRTRQ